MNKIAEKALERVNELREALGEAPLEDLPKGMKRRAGFCPLALALNALVCKTAISFMTKHKDLNRSAAITAAKLWRVHSLLQNAAVPIHKDLEEFVMAFDNGLLPEYEAEVTDDRTS